MAEFPAMPLWTDAYIGDTVHLTALEHGAYLMILMAMWRTRDGTIPDNDQFLARVGRCTTKEWNRISPTIRAFLLPVDGGKVTQERLRDEFLRIRRLSEVQRDKANAMWLKKKKPRHAGAYERHMPNESRDDAETMPPISTPTPIEEDKQESPLIPIAPAEVTKLLDRIIVETFGPELARPFANSTDHVFAKRILETGADLPLIEGVFRSISARFKAEGQGPPRSVRMFEPWIAGALIDQNKPATEARHVNGNGHAKPAKQTPFERAQAFIDSQRDREILNPA